MSGLTLRKPHDIASFDHLVTRLDDSGEAIEVCGPAGTDLSQWTVLLYNGNGGGVCE